jgi:hypothetical protein
MRAIGVRVPVALALLVAIVVPAGAYTQDKPLEAALARNDRAALALLPAKGYHDGAAGFFAAHELHVVPGSERAWCTPQAHGVLAAGCYIEFMFKPPGETSYRPTKGAYYSHAIADDRAEIIEHVIYEEPRQDCR